MEEVSRSVVTSLRLLLICQAAGLVLALTAGGTLIAHVGQFSECLLFSYKGKQVERKSQVTLNIVFAFSPILPYYLPTNKTLLMFDKIA